MKYSWNILCHMGKTFNDVDEYFVTWSWMRVVNG